MKTERRDPRLFSRIEIALRDIQRVERQLENGHQGKDLLRSAKTAISLGLRSNAIEKLKQFQYLCNASPEARALVGIAIDELNSKSAKFQFIKLNGSTWTQGLLNELWEWRFKIAVWMWIKLGLPLISDRKNHMKRINCNYFIDNICGLSEVKFKKLASRAPTLYFTRSEPKPSGRHRVISAPYSNLKAVQQELRDLLNQVPIPDGICGKKGTSTISAMRPHVRKPMVITLDIADFYPSITSKQIAHVLNKLLDDEAQISNFVRLVTRKNVLPQGAPTSPVLARLVVVKAFEEIQKAIQGICPGSGISMWVDDITISGPEGLKRSIPLIRKILKRHGFRLRDEKIRVLPKNREQSNLGLKVNHRIEASTTIRERYHQCVAQHGFYSKQAEGYRRYFQSVNNRGAA
jgi:hypothetical protein